MLLLINIEDFEVDLIRQHVAKAQAAPETWMPMTDRERNEWIGGAVHLLGVVLAATDRSQKAIADARAKEAAKQGKSKKPVACGNAAG